jgi:hypothetical protein
MAVGLNDGSVSMSEMYCRSIGRLGRVAVLSAAMALLGYTLPAQSQERQSECVRMPADITSINKSSIKGEDCHISSGRASLGGEPGDLLTFRFRDGATIKVLFKSECPKRMVGPCRIYYSLGRGEWQQGVFEQPNALMHKCGQYSCNWETYRNGYGMLVVATPFSY